MVTSNTALGRAPGNVRLRPGSAGVSRDSVVNVTQVMTLDRSRLTEKIGSLPEFLLCRVLDGVALVLGIA
jgi:mRNA interferase MazF